MTEENTILRARRVLRSIERTLVVCRRNGNGSATAETELEALRHAVLRLTESRRERWRHHGGPDGWDGETARLLAVAERQLGA
jgi:hypothetical protein